MPLKKEKTAESSVRMDELAKKMTREELESIQQLVNNLDTDRR